MSAVSRNAPGSAPPPLVVSGAIVAATLTTAVPGYTWALSLATTVAGDIGPQLGALCVEALQALVMALFGALVVRAHLRGRGRWIGLLFAPIDLALVLAAGVWTIGRVPLGQGAGVFMLATAVGVLVAVALQAVVIGIVWLTLAWVARAYRRSVRPDGSAVDADALAHRAWRIALVVAAIGSAVHVLLKMLPGPTAIGVLGALATCVLAGMRRNAPANRTVVVTAGICAALVVFVGSLAQGSHLLTDATARRVARAVEHEACARSRSGSASNLETAAADVPGVAVARVTYGEERIGEGPLVVWIAPTSGDSITPALRGSIERATANVLCREDFGTDWRREIRRARRRPIAIRAHGRLATWADREVSERSLRDELARWLDDEGTEGLGTERRLSGEPPSDYRGFDGIVLNVERPTLAADDLAVLGTVTLTLDVGPDASVIADAGTDRDE